MKNIHTVIIDLLCKIEGFKTCLKIVHWNAKSLSEHRLCDDVQDELGEYEDTIAELEQAITDIKITEEELIPQAQSAESLTEFLNILLSDIKTFYEQIVQGDVSYVGISSETETFIGKLQKFIYQASFCKGNVLE